MANFPDDYDSIIFSLEQGIIDFDEDDEMDDLEIADGGDDIEGLRFFRWMNKGLDEQMAKKGIQTPEQPQRKARTSSGDAVQRARLFREQRQKNKRKE